MALRRLCFQTKIRFNANFLGNNKAPEYEEGVSNLIESYEEMGCRMSFKIHFLRSHLDFFPENIGAVSDEQGERFHKGINNMETRYQGFWNEDVMADHCCILYRDTPDKTFQRKSHAQRF